MNIILNPLQSNTKKGDIVLPAKSDLTGKENFLVVVANDSGSRTYALDLSAVPAWKGRLRQLRLDLATGQPLTGTCRFDYVWITSAAARP